MITGKELAHALSWLEFNLGDIRAGEWRKKRNEFMRAQGIGGVFREGKKSLAIPDWWPAATEFWFHDPAQEQAFIEKWTEQ